MNKRFMVFMIAGLFSSLMLHAQLRKVPADVTNAFQTKYPDATNVEWKDNLTNFEAEFKMDDDDYSASFSSKGEWKETTSKMDFAALPASVKDGFAKSKYNDWTTGTVTLIERNDEEKMYKIYAEKNSIVQKRFLYFNTEGQLKKETPGI